MSQVGESSFVPASEPEEKEEEIEKIKIRISLFFDGTLNNRINIDQRIADEQDPDTNAIYKKYKGKSESYEGDYTNVARMEKYIYDSDGYDVTLSVYTEGPGTEDNKKDSLLGYALGVGGTGVTEKVEKGICEAVDLVNEQVSDKKKIIEQLTLDVFGFSRGAAGARNCIYEVLSTGKKPIKDRITEKGYDIRKVEICFAGLYDTVSSHGLSFTNDTSALKLNAVANAKRVVQFAAADEHRRNFSLTDINSAGKNKGLQLFLPGAHSDIGGGYRAPVAGKPSEHQAIYRSFFENDIEKEKKRLIDAGWYRADEIEVIQLPSSGPAGLDNFIIEVKREQIGNKYRTIPFNLMADNAKECGISFRPKISCEAVPGTLKDVESKMRQYAAKAGNSSTSEDWARNEPWLVKLRHDHLHFSARLEFGHGPRISGGKRVRMLLHG